MQITFTGRIDQSEFHNGKTYTILTTPAPDSFSHPSRYRVASQQALGAQGQTVRLTCDVRGHVRERQYRDKQTGEQKIFHDSSVRLDVVSVEAAEIKPTKAG